MSTEDWFEKWWADLPKHHFTSQNKGSKAECWKEVQKLSPDDKLMEHITWYTKELALRTAKLKKTDQRVPGWRHAVRLIRYQFWSDDLPETGAYQKQEYSGAKCDCGKKVDIIHEGKGKCWGCYGWVDRFKSERKAALGRIGLPVPNNKADVAKWQQDCRSWCQANAKRILGNTITK